MTTPASLQHALRTALKEHGDPARAKQQQAYMKSAMPYAGVPVPETTRMARQLVRDSPFPDRTTWLAAILKLWREARVREERYAALTLIGMTQYRHWRNVEMLEVYEELIVTGAWWDFVDEISTKLVGELLDRDPKSVAAELKRWATTSGNAAPPSSPSSNSRRVPTSPFSRP